MIDSEFERKGREMATTWDNLLETNDALMRRIAELERERDAATKRAEQAEADARKILVTLGEFVGSKRDNAAIFHMTKVYNEFVDKYLEQ